MYVYTEIYTINNISEMKGYTGAQETILPWDMGMKSQEGDTLSQFIVYCTVFKNHKHVLFYNIIKTLKVFKKPESTHSRLRNTDDKTSASILCCLLLNGHLIKIRRLLGVCFLKSLCSRWRENVENLNVTLLLKL